MTNPSERQCPDCEAAMVPIMIIDRSRLNEFQSMDGVLSYTTPNAKPGWLGAFKAEGTISAFACSGCGRVVLYAQSK